MFGNIIGKTTDFFTQIIGTDVNTLAAILKFLMKKLILHSAKCLVIYRLDHRFLHTDYQH